MTDDELGLVQAAQAGDRMALDAVLRSLQPAVYAICRRIAGNEPDALDAMQDALIAIVRGLERFDGRSKVSTWAYRIATNSCLDEMRRRQRRPIPGLPDDDRSGRAQPGRIDEQVAARIDVDTALQTLPLDFRVAVVLRDLCSLDYAEIAEVLDIAPGTVRSRIARGRAALAERLTGQTGGQASGQPSSQPSGQVGDRDRGNQPPVSRRQTPRP